MTESQIGKFSSYDFGRNDSNSLWCSVAADCWAPLPTRHCKADVGKSNDDDIPDLVTTVASAAIAARCLGWIGPRNSVNTTESNLRPMVIDDWKNRLLEKDFLKRPPDGVEKPIILDLAPARPETGNRPTQKELAPGSSPNGSTNEKGVEPSPELSKPKVPHNSGESPKDTSKVSTPEKVLNVVGSVDLRKEDAKALSAEEREHIVRELHRACKERDTNFFSNPKSEAFKKFVSDVIEAQLIAGAHEENAEFLKNLVKGEDTLTMLREEFGKLEGAPTIKSRESEDHSGSGKDSSEGRTKGGAEVTPQVLHEHNRSSKAGVVKASLSDDKKAIEKTAKDGTTQKSADAKEQSKFEKGRQLGSKLTGLVIAYGFARSLFEDHR